MNVLALYSTASPYIMSAIVGLLLSALAIYYKNRYFSKRILCIFYTEDKRVEQVLLKPNEHNHLVWKEGSYIYNKDLIRLSSYMTQRVPCLSFSENEVIPLSVDKEVTHGAVLPHELHDDFNDKSSKDLAVVAHETSEGGGLKEIKQFLLVGLAGIAVLIVGAIWFIANKLNEVAAAG